MRKLFFILFSVFWLNGFSQANLVPNPSFEGYNYCAPAVVGNSNPGGVVLQDWYNPNTSTPDYYNMCWLAPPPKTLCINLLMEMDLWE